MEASRCSAESQTNRTNQLGERHYDHRTALAPYFSFEQRLIDLVEKWVPIYG
jgi:hypothetical protein